MQAWQWLVQQAILGAERSGFQVASADKQLSHDDTLLRQLLLNAAPAESSSQLLHTAALFNQIRWAGAKPSVMALPLTGPVCPPESLRPVHAAAAAFLRQLLAAQEVRLISRWLDYAAAAHCHLPFDLLPQLLELATAQRELADHLAPCLGERGRWLLGLNPGWQVSAAQPISADDWQVGNIQARTAFLRTIRQAEAAKGRDLLVAVWPQEAAKDRVLLLAALAVNLSRADETFLERCLTDRSEHVRSAAVRLLAQLDDSAVQCALYASIGKLLRLERRWLRRTLQVDLPATFAPEWQRLAIKESATFSEKLGQRAGWLVQLLALARPTTVAQQLQLGSAELLEYVAGHDFAAALQEGLLNGAETHEDHEFAALYLQSLPSAEFPTAFARWAVILPDSQREAALLHHMRQYAQLAFADWNALTPVLQVFEELSVPLSEQLLRCLLPAFPTQVGASYGVRTALREAAYRLAPAVYPQVEASLPYQREERPDFISEFLRIYQMRYQMEQAFQAR